MRVKKGLRGRRSAPSPDKKAPGVLVVLWLPKEAVKIPEMEGTNLPREKHVPWGSLSQGAGVITRSALFGENAYSGFLEKACSRKTEQKGENKNRHKKQRSTLAALRPENRASEGGRVISAPQVPRESKKNAETPGAQNGTPTKREKEGTHGQKREINPVRWGQKQEKGTKTQGACGGVPCYLSFLSSKKGGDDGKTKRRENEPQKNKT